MIFQYNYICINLIRGNQATTLLVMSDVYHQCMYAFIHTWVIKAFYNKLMYSNFMHKKICSRTKLLIYELHIH